jgi:DNA-binding response OmpR family regulator
MPMPEPVFQMSECRSAAGLGGCSRVQGVASAGGGSQTALQGVTILLVEDSRFASDALRLFCQRLGARFRRADCVAAAHRHLQRYDPNVIIIDLGLPDGPGEELIADLARAPFTTCPVILGTSGSVDGRERAMKAGAMGYLEKPLPSLVVFAASIRSALEISPPASANQHAAPPASASSSAGPQPDPLALRDDLRHAASLLGRSITAHERLYLAGFIASLGQSSGDADLTDAAGKLRLGQCSKALVRLLQGRLAAADGAFS